MKKSVQNEKGAVELIVIALIGVLIIVLAIPLLTDVGTKAQSNLSSVNSVL